MAAAAAPPSSDQQPSSSTNQITNSFNPPAPNRFRYPSLSASAGIIKSPANSALHNHPRPNVVEILEQRGLLESLTGENLRTICSDSSVRVYCGFDPTAESLHLGNLIGIIVLSWFLRCGHSVVALVGGATGRVGDPSGKSLERPELDAVGVLGASQFLTEALRPGSETRLDWKTIEGISEDVPSCSLVYDRVLDVSVVDLSVTTGLIESKSAARRLLKQGGLYLNNGRVDNEGKKIDADDIVDGKVLLLSAGKKNKMVVRLA